MIKNNQYSSKTPSERVLAKITREMFRVAVPFDINESKRRAAVKMNMTTLMSFTQWFNIGSRNDGTLDVMSGLYHLLGRERRGVERFTQIYNQNYDKRS